MSDRLYWLGLFWIPALILAGLFAWLIFTTATLPPLSCHPTPHAAIQLNCVKGHLAP